MFQYSHGMLTVHKEVVCSNVGRQIWLSRAIKEGPGCICVLHMHKLQPAENI